MQDLLHVLGRRRPLAYPGSGNGKVVDLAARTAASMGSVPEVWKPALRCMAETWVGLGGEAWNRAAAQQLSVMLGTGDAAAESDQPLPLKRGDAWANAALDQIEGAGAEGRAKWRAVLEHAVTAPVKPGKAWRKAAVGVIEPLGWEPFQRAVEGWFAHVGEPGTDMDPQRRPYEHDHPTALTIDGTHAATGLLWMLGLAPGEAGARVGAGAGAGAERAAGTIAGLAERGFARVGRGKLRSEALGKAAVRALGEMESRAAVEHLARLELTIRVPTAKKAITSTLATAAKSQGVTAAELAESAVPGLGLVDGVVTLPLGDAAARITAEGETARVAWVKSDGSTTARLPKEVKADHPDAAKEAKEIVASLEAGLTAQRRRVERLMREPRTWPVALWRKRYLDHPLVSLIARRLIWQVGDDDVCWHDGALHTLEGNEVTPADDSPVRLWHPLGKPVETVTAWRERLEALGITQPFKQAHREVYVLTDAERNTGTYSNRFAAHVLRNLVLIRLCQNRGWSCGLFGGDSGPRVALPEFDLRAEYWVQEAGDQHTNDLGAPLYVATDQVRFYSEGEREPLRLDGVEPLALSEVMRDVDLFVGVCSVGNDPQWADAGPAGRYRDYWQDYAFGDLSATAKTRGEVLKRLVPRLKIADRCGVDEKFLRVRGDRRTYKIHLGSGNILMEPNDQYLCIVPDSAATRGADAVKLPFEGDRTLAIILSKAMLLADDTDDQGPDHPVADRQGVTGMQSQSSPRRPITPPAQRHMSHKPSRGAAYIASRPDRTRFRGCRSPHSEPGRPRPRRARGRAGSLAQQRHPSISGCTPIPSSRRTTLDTGLSSRQNDAGRPA